MNMKWTSEEERKAYHRAMAAEEVAAECERAGLTRMRTLLAMLREERRRREWDEDTAAIQLGNEIAMHRLAVLAGRARYEPETAMGEGGADGE